MIFPRLNTNQIWQFKRFTLLVFTTKRLVYSDEGNFGVLLGRRKGCVRNGETYRDDNVVLLINKGLNVLRIIGLGLGFDILVFPTQFFDSF